MELTHNLEDIRPVPGSFPIGHFEGKDRYLRFDLNAFAELESRYGSMDGVEEAMQKSSMKDLRFLLWAGLLHEGAEVDPFTGDVVKYNITPFQVGAWITMQNIGSITAAISKAMASATPTEKQVAPMLASATPKHPEETVDENSPESPNS